MANSRKDSASSRKEAPKQNTNSTKPAATVRQGNLKVVLWRNLGENGPWYVADLVRTFKNESGEYQETNKVPADDLLRVSYLATRAFEELQVLRTEDRANDRPSQRGDDAPAP